MATGYEWLSMVMFLGFFVFLMSGYPVAFSFAGTAMVFGLLGLAIDAFEFSRVLLLPSRWFLVMSDFTLLAIPFFIYMGAILEKSGLAEDLLETAAMLFGPLRGGLALAVVFVGTLLAATTGVVAATVIAMGMITLPVMLRLGYDKELSTGVIAATGTLAQMIPPSLVLVVLSQQIGVSVGDLFAGALIPGLMLAGSFGLYCVFVAYREPHKAPPLPPELRNIKGSVLARRAVKAIFPPVALILAVLGSIFFGFATPTEAGAVGAIGTILLAWANGQLNFKLIRDSADSTAGTTALVLMILFCSTFFAIVFDGLGGNRFVTDFLVNLPGGVMTFMVVSNIVVFLLGIFLEFVEISFIVMPLLVPAASALGIDLVWFGVVMAINLQTAFVSPPVGFSLFYLQSVVPDDVETWQIHKGVLPFMALQVVILFLVMFFPSTVTWLVELSYGK
jgi:tripartite ATP-independent transporter DctM subunit